MPLMTHAERQAEAARKIDGFKDFALDGVRDKVATILGMIGRVEGVFSTYTLHDISHVDAMLNMLDWLIPPETRKQLTPVEWLLLVLSFYFHDLGMVVTTNEFLNREDNPLFCDFIESLKSDPNSRDYLDRLASIPERERDVFLFQEFIRANHAHRIREWVTGERRAVWGNNLTPVAEEISSVMSSLPARFRRNLADICESHHRDNLEDRAYFPLCQHYGPPEAMANVQYVALLLRTSDLLHITKDRTPSIMFRTLNISDLMGIDEWKKQMGTFAVHMKTREFLPSDPGTHFILIGADFDEERPFFVLTEYIAYANQQLGQSYRWASKSQQESDTEHYLFPWHRVEGDIRVEGNEPMPMRFELDRGRLLNLLVGHTIYNDPTVAVRELLQNAIDAVRYQYYLDGHNVRPESSPASMGVVSVRWNSAKRQLVVQDQGVGMDMDVIQYHLMTVGASFYDTPAFKADSADFIPISRFGIGILTCFMVSDNVEIRTWKGGQGHRIRMSSVQADYLLKELRDGDRLPGEDSEHGTSVSLILRPSVDLSEKSLLDILKHWVVMPACEVVYQEDDQQPENIGFPSPSAALRYYLFDSDDDQRDQLDPTNIDIEERKLLVDGAQYQLAYAVQRGYTPERDFVAMKPSKAPGTCLEGIRVDSSLPGFKETAAILSVRDNRAFRTIVSRDRLERDDEYTQVARLCARMLQDHISDEVTRIQKADGHPLSQASTAARWLFQTLLENASAETTLDQGRQFYRALPHVVTESRAADSDSITPTRHLVSLDDLASKEHFWTIDARVVDYLGVISRDLGRELSFGEFLSGIAPDLFDSSMTPVVSDAQHYAADILTTHCCQFVKFSKRHQQTAVKWVQRSDPQETLLLDKAEADAVTQRLGEVREFSRYDPYTFDRTDFHNPFKVDNILAAEIKGDVKGVKAVRTRLAVILMPGSDWANLWTNIRHGVAELRKEVSLADFATLWCVAIVLHTVLMNREPFRYESFGSLGSSGSTLKLVWKELLTREGFSKLLQKLGVELPDDISEFTVDEYWFDATQYWLNWDR